jgi:hypothetical protein
MASDRRSDEVMQLRTIDPTPPERLPGRRIPDSPEIVQRRHRPPGGHTCPLLKESSMSLLWILVIALIILAVAGGAAVNSFLWLVLIVALIVAVFAIISGRRAV